MEFTAELALLDFTEEDNAFLEACRMIEEAFTEYKPMSMYDEYMAEAFGKKQNANVGAENQAKADAAAQQQTQNDAAANKGKSGIMKAIDAVINMIRKIKNSIMDFIDKRKLDNMERQAYEEFQAACAQDPSLKNKKVTVKDWKKIQAVYDNYIQECEKAYEDVARNVETPIEGLINKGKNLAKDIAKGALISIPATSVMNLASTNKQTAKVLRAMLNSNEEAMVKLREEMGKKQVKSIDKDLKMWSKRVSIKRWIIKITGEYYDNWADAIASPLVALRDISKGKINPMDRTQRQLAGNILNNRATGGAIKGTVGTAASIGAKGAAQGVGAKAKYIGKKLVSFHPGEKNLDAPDDPTDRPKFARNDKGVLGTIFTKPSGGNVKAKRQKMREAKKNK